MKYLTIVLFFLVGCVAVPPPNVYQERGTGPMCEEFEYRWKTVSGDERSAFHTGSGGFCIHLENLDRSQPEQLQVRCVTRDVIGNILQSSPWTHGARADSVVLFNDLCPQT